MWSIVPHLITIVISSIFTIGFTIFFIRRAFKDVEPMFYEALNEMKNQVQSEIEPMKNAVSRSMGIISNQAVASRKLKTAEKYLGEDLLQNYEMYLPMIETVSPKFADYLRENPEIIPKLAPRIEGILSKSGIDLSEILNQNTKVSKPHPFGMKEE